MPDVVTPLILFYSPHASARIEALPERQVDHHKSRCASVKAQCSPFVEEFEEWQPFQCPSICSGQQTPAECNWDEDSDLSVLCPAGQTDSTITQIRSARPEVRGPGCRFAPSLHVPALSSFQPTPIPVLLTRPKYREGAERQQECRRVSISCQRLHVFLHYAA